MLHVDGAAGPPVLAAVPGEEPVIHEVAAERDVVVVEPTERLVHLALGVPDPGLELEGEPREDDRALLVLRGDLTELAAAKVRAEHRLLLVEHGAQRKPGVSGRPRLLRRVAKGLGLQAIGPPVGVDARHLRRGELRQVSPDSVRGQPEVLDELRLRSGAAGKRTRDRESFRIGEKSEEFLRRHTSASKAFGTVSVGATLYQTCSSVPFSSTRKDERITPCHPGPNGSPHTP